MLTWRLFRILETGYCSGFGGACKFLHDRGVCSVQLPEGDEDEESTAGPSSTTESRRVPSGEPPVITRTTNGVMHWPVFSRFQTANNQSTPHPAPRTKSVGDLRNTKSTPKVPSPNSPRCSPLRSPPRQPRSYEIRYCILCVPTVEIVQVLSLAT